MWARVESILPGKATDPGVTAADNRQFLETVFWRIRTGSPWRAFRRSSATGTACSSGSAAGLFRVSSSVSSTCCRMSSTSSTCLLTAPSSRRTRRRRVQRGTCHQGIGRSQGGLSSKIVAVADALGYLVRFMILPGLVHDLAGGAGTSGGSSVRGLDRGQGIRRGLVARGTREAWR